MWESWTKIQPKKLSSIRDIYIGCMTGTSADSTADFTAAAFDDDGYPICFKNYPVTIPKKLCASLLALSKADRNTILRREGNILESQLTAFLASAFLTVIDKIGLKDYPKDQILLSPHGQALDHQPQGRDFYTDIIINGPVLAQQTGYKVVTQHRQAPLAVSMAAPLAPVLIKKLFFNPRKNVVLINGGGIANITVLFKNNPEKIIGFDTGPANAPIDSLIQYIIDENFTDDIPIDLRKAMQLHRFDVDGKLAQSGQMIEPLYQKLLQHEFFIRDIKLKSADRSDFDLKTWLLPAIQQLHLKHFSWLDIITTVSAVVADSIVESVIKTSDLSQETCVIHYGGMCHNHYLLERINHGLQKSGKFECKSMQVFNYTPDYFEALLMAYLGYCAHYKIAINLSYCARSETIAAYAIPGVVAYPVTNKHHG